MTVINHGRTVQLPNGSVLDFEYISETVEDEDGTTRILLERNVWIDGVRIGPEQLAQLRDELRGDRT